MKRLFVYLIKGVVGVIILTAGVVWWAQSGGGREWLEKWSNETDQALVLVPDQMITVMTYNVGYFSGLSNNQSIEREVGLFATNMTKAVEMIIETEPDVLAVQEIDYEAKRSGYVDQLGELQKRVSMPNIAQVVTWDKQYVPFPPGSPKNYFGRVLSGQAVLSKYPILKQERVELSRPPLPWYRDMFYLNRVAQVVTLDAGRPVIVINVHLDHEYPDTRRQQLLQVADLYQQYANDYPVVLMGDFNAVPSDADTIYETDISLVSFNNLIGLREVLAGQVKEQTLTYRSDSPDRKLDHVFFNDNYISLVKAEVVRSDKNPSDHHAVAATLGIK